LQLECIEQLDKIVGERRLLTGARRRGGEELRRTIAAQIGHDGSAPGGNQRRDDLVIGARIMGEAVQEDHRRSVRRPALLVGDFQRAGAEALQIYRSGHGLPRRSLTLPQTRTLSASRAT
jgi:hypothetical protein